jgi:hypothetical protein
MQKFEYRIPRYVVDLPVMLTLEGLSIPGRCREISIEGMRVELRQPAPPESSGTVSIHYRELSLELPVCVTHSGTGHDGLKFQFEAEKDRTAVERLVSLLAGSTGQPGPVLVR